MGPLFVFLVRDQIASEFGDAFDQVKDNLGHIDDEDFAEEPWRYLKRWRLLKPSGRGTYQSTSFPLDMTVRGNVLEGWLIPRDKDGPCIRVCLDNLDFGALDRETSTRGWWIQTKRSRGGQPRRPMPGVLYWLQEAAEPELHLQSRTVLGLLSNLLDRVFVDPSAATYPISVALKPWLSTMAERGVDAKSVLTRYQADVEHHLTYAVTTLIPSCAFLKSLRGLKKTKHKISQDLGEFCVAAEVLCKQHPWGGSLKLWTHAYNIPQVSPPLVYPRQDDPSRGSLTEDEHDSDDPQPAKLARRKSRGKERKSQDGANTGRGTVQVGSRVEVFWPSENASFPGTVDEIQLGKFHVCYDDGDEYWVSTSDEYRVLKTRGNDSDSKGNQLHGKRSAPQNVGSASASTRKAIQTETLTDTQKPSKSKKRDLLDKDDSSKRIAKKERNSVVGCSVMRID